MKKRVMSRSNNRRNQRRAGFTLLELLIVLGIILAIAAMVVPNLLGRQQEANVKLTKTTIANVENAFKQYAATVNQGEFPPGSGVLDASSQILQVLTNPEPTTDGQRRQPFLDTIPLDAWGNPLFYSYDSASMVKPLIQSYGKDGTQGGGDDVSNQVGTPST